MESGIMISIIQSYDTDSKLERREMLEMQHSLRGKFTRSNPCSNPIAMNVSKGGHWQIIAIDPEQNNGNWA